jgi:histidyl-tRNA synthetase
MLVRLLEKAGVGGCSVVLNSLGCAECRKAYREILLGFLHARSETLCEPCKGRIERNPLRALDCKIDGPRLAQEAPKLALCPSCAEHFSRTQELLKISGVEHQVNTSLVRGLDYYTGTVFEVRSSALGSQDAVCGGGRYDDLVRAMGGPAAPAIGWAVGLDRMAMLRKDNPAPDNTPKVFVAAAVKEAGEKAFALLAALRAAGISSDFSNFELSLKSQMRSAGKSGASYALIMGEDEIKAGTVAVKPLKEHGEQTSVPLSDAPAHIKRLLN